MAYIGMKTEPDRPQFDRAELAVLLRCLKEVIGRHVPGDVVELGCYKGETSVELARLLRQLAPDRQLWVYDSFAGLPPKTPADESPLGMQFQAGELPATKREVVQRLRAAGFAEVRVKKAWFQELTSQDVPETICLAFLDGDFYESIDDSLRLVWDHLSPGALVVVDDYANPALPGAARAVDAWLEKHPASFSVEQSLGIIRR